MVGFLPYLPHSFSLHLSVCVSDVDRRLIPPETPAFEPPLEPPLEPLCVEPSLEVSVIIERLLSPPPHVTEHSDQAAHCSEAEHIHIRFF